MCHWLAARLPLGHRSWYELHVLNCIDYCIDHIITNGRSRTQCVFGDTPEH